MRNRKPVTGQQLVALRFIGKFHRDNGYSPNYQEIAAALGSEHHAAGQQMVARLAKRGLAKVEPNLRRSVRLTTAGWKVYLDGVTLGRLGRKGKG